jgi:hypothetical protein
LIRVEIAKDVSGGIFMPEAAMREPEQIRQD